MDLGMDLARLYVITDSSQAPNLVETVAASLEAGARLIQMREKHRAPAERADLARRLATLTGRHGARLLINGDPEISGGSGADGVHRPADGPEVGDIRQRLGADDLVGVSAHSRAELDAAAAQGADFATFSPIFETASKPGYGPALGVGRLAAACREVDLPIYALAGITLDRVGRCLQAGAHGVAVMGGIMRPEHTGQAVSAYLDAIAAHGSAASAD